MIRTTPGEHTSVTEKLDQAGAEGWEVVGLSPIPGAQAGAPLLFLAKRPLPGPTELNESD
jgi:hypothetical protein